MEAQRDAGSGPEVCVLQIDVDTSHASRKTGTLMGALLPLNAAIRLRGFLQQVLNYI